MPIGFEGSPLTPNPSPSRGEGRKEKGNAMRIAITLTPPTDRYFRWAAQIGVTDFVCRYPPHYGLPAIDGLTQMKQRAERFGLNLTVVEGYLPIERIVLG